MIAALVRRALGERAQPAMSTRRIVAVATLLRAGVLEAPELASLGRHRAGPGTRPTIGERRS